MSENKIFTIEDPEYTEQEQALDNFVLVEQAHNIIPVSRSIENIIITQFRQGELEESGENTDAAQAEQTQPTNANASAPLTMEEFLTQHAKVCRNYFIIGCFLVPAVLLTNYIWNRKFIETLKKQEKSKTVHVIERYLNMSLYLFLLYTALILAWVIYFQTNRLNLGALGDRLSFYVPEGRL